MSHSPHSITLIYGDGIGPEVIGATKEIIEAAGVAINWEVCEAGKEVFAKGIGSGVPQETIESIRRTKCALKGPLETPVGFGGKSANVTLRKLFETYANIRPVREFPGVPTPYSGRKIDFVIVRENVEDLYAGIEYMQTPGAAECLKLITREGCEKICRVAFEFARSEGRKSVHCATKANIMKLSEGMLKRTFEEVAEEYKDIEAHHVIVDNCAHQLVRKPEQFETIVTTNMNGDILSDLGSGLIGGLGFAPGSNLGADVAIFEAVHGSAPKYAGKNAANPTAMLLSGLMMLRHLGEFEAASTIEQAVLVTLGEDKIHTYDVLEDTASASTTEYTAAIIKNLGKTSSAWEGRTYKKLRMPEAKDSRGTVAPTSRRVRGLDVFIESPSTPLQLGEDLDSIVDGTPLELKMISSRGVKVYPAVGSTNPDVADHWQCRFVLRNDNNDLAHTDVNELLSRIDAKYRWMHIEKLNVFNDEQAYSKAQGED